MLVEVKSKPRTEDITEHIERKGSILPGNGNPKKAALMGG